ncbi:hypothetical protein B0181_01355 [Moraxella caviae]|uniref:Uncharacterized protein n=1 Tax=Moraxella caviae TaxID=34060 RepID=A0A1T0AB03_9GAMM|nr:hypothetical protein [Moraxella caviae]OOR92838.1 hypothetical protein B0181_01355 [Moraxella caviae]STZ14154.1 Uncharacterised protein [Moraxella caviae]VEW12600.1 Uncharacterised protein [Moraxella caviae]
MTYLAPRQGLFAAIVLLSLCLHTLFFVLSEEREIGKQHHAAAELSASLLAGELTVPLTANDRVSMSVIAKRYADDSQIAFAGVYDAKNQLLVPVGDESGSGMSAKEPVVSGEKVLGGVMVKTKPISRAQIISDHWEFLLAVLGLHVLIFLVYGYVARPSKELKEQIAKNVRARLLEKGLLSPAALAADSQKSYADKSHAEKADKAHASSGTDGDDTEHLANPNSSDAQNTASTDENSAPNGTTSFTMQVLFDDPNRLLAAVGRENKLAYFALCDQLLEKATHELLQLPLLAGVHAQSPTTFNDVGASVVLYGEHPAKVATAAVFLSKLTLLLNQVVYDKHRELRRFALQVRTTASDTTSAQAVRRLAQKRREVPLILMNEHALREVEVYVGLARLTSPSSVEERESRQLQSVTKATADRLRSVRDSVLLAD